MKEEAVQEGAAEIAAEIAVATVGAVEIEMVVVGIATSGGWWPASRS